MRRIIVVVALLAALFATSTHAATLIISEFMASNSRTLQDEDNAYSDWVEIHNTTGTNVSLAGWFLTDNAASLTKWQFPATNIGPNGFVIVFCDGKNRRVPGAPLHTSFNLSAGGEYLALVRPDGLTIESQFAPDFGQQYTDVAYGYLMSGTTFNLVTNGAAARAFVPSADIGTSWQTLPFDDSGWLTGVTGVGYDASTNYTSAIGLDVNAAMSNINASAYVRVPFNVADAAALKILSLRMRYDDGFVAYLNGTEVLRRNAPLAVSWNSAATNRHGGATGGSLVEDFEGATSNFTLSQLGAAPPASVQAAGAGTTGKFLRLLTDAVNSQGNAIAFKQTAPGLWQTITADFDFRVTDAAANPADGFAFMLIPTSTYGTNGPGYTQNIAVEEPNIGNVFAIGFDVYPHGSQNDVSVHWNATEYLNVTMPKPTIDLVSGTFHRAHVVLEHVTGGARVTVTFTPNINSGPGAPYTPITNLFVAGLNPYDCRVQFQGRTGGADMSVDLDNVNVQFQSAPGSLAYESFDISQYLPALVTGPNILAIQGLNVSANDTNFLIGPELAAAAFTISTNLNFISPATPGTWNNVSAAGTLPEVTLSPKPGVYTNSVAVTMSSVSSSAQIRYTTDGSDPTAASLLYTNPLLLSANTVLRARAIEPFKIDGPITGGNYIVLDNTLTNFTSNLGLVFIDTVNRAIIENSKIPAYAIFYDTNASGLRTSVNQPINHRGRIGIEIAGQSSVGFPKKQYNVETQDETGDGKDVALMGFPKGGNDFRLYAPYTDKTLMNDLLTYELHEAMGHYSVRRKFVEVFIRSSAGKMAYSDYQGVYVLLEKIRIDPNRVDISKPQTGDTNSPITGGYIWKKDKDSPGTVGFTTWKQPNTAAQGEFYQFHDPSGSKLSLTQRNWLINHLNVAETNLYTDNIWRHPTLGYRRYFDVASWVDFHWIVEFPKQIDGYRLSNYLHKDRGGLIKDEPIWDWNLAWGNANYLEGGNTNGWYWPQISETQDMYLRRMRGDPEFVQAIIDRWGELRTNIFNLSNLLARINAKTNLLNEAKDRDFVKWPRLNTYVWPNPDGNNVTAADNSTAVWNVNYAVVNSYSELIGEMKKWVTGRYAWVDSQFLKGPTADLSSGTITPGATVNLIVPSGTIYYTLDGTDPRGSNGVISASARLYSGTITLTNNSGLFARVYQSSSPTNSWSWPARAVYVVDTPTLRITELMFHPSDPPLGSTNAEEDFEFVEIQNTGTNIINLRNCQLGGGIQFTFPASNLAPGQFVLVVKSIAAFQSRYGAGFNIVGEYTGKLANSGDRVVLTGPVGEPIHDFKYNDNWYPLTDGSGFSLVPRNVNAALSAWSDSAAWRSSSQFGGSPGAVDPDLNIAPIVINEILANSVFPAKDWIELYNPTATNVDIGGWYLSDNFSNAKKFRIPANTIINAGGYLVFTEDDFNPDPSGLTNTNSFALGSDGDDVWLFSGDAAGNLTGYVDGFDFGASDEGVTFGRHVASDGDVDYPAQVLPTPGAVNAGPIIGPIVISEIMYRPPDTVFGDNSDDEFIELQNISAGAVALYSSASPDKTWHLRNAVDFDFPTNVTLAAGERVLVVNFNPTNTTTLAAFRSKYGVSPGVQVFGPYGGKLDNSGERIELRRPGQPGTNGIPYLQLEKVTFSDHAPWPAAADGYGASLQRVNLGNYGNDPANWVAAVPSAGASFAAGTPPAITQAPNNISTFGNMATNLTVGATGPALRYQWRFEALNMTNETNATLNFPNIQPANSGRYSVAVFNVNGGTVLTALVTVLQPVTFTVQPANVSLNPGSNTTLIVSASGNGPVSYQWRLYGTNLPGATRSSFGITNADLFTHAGIYDVVATDGYSTVTSSNATVLVLVKPFLTNLPPSVTVLQGGNARYELNAGPIHPTLPLSHRWILVGGALGTTTNLTNKVLYIFNCQTNGTLRAQITNPAGQTNVTSGITLTVLPDFDGDGIADAWEVKYNSAQYPFSTNNAADALLDYDGDGAINRDEYVAGTNPTNALSVLKLLGTNSTALRFVAESNISYTIQVKPDINLPWQNWSNVNPQSTPRNIEFTEPRTNGQRYYRVMTPQVQP